jgi:hypothetical protein
MNEDWVRAKDVTLGSVPACKAQPVRAHSWTLPVAHKLAIHRCITANGNKTMALN